MKKKILNALLMGVLVMTSMSVFVSCKDYDDDIDDLRVEQAELLSKLEVLDSDVASQTSSITSQITSLQSSLSSLDATLTASINTAAETAKNAGSAAAAAQTSADGAAADAAAAQATADEALETAKKALEAAEDATASTTAKTALEQITELSNKLGSLETLDNGIAGLVEQVNNAATKEELNTLKTSVNKYQSYFDNLFAMVTSVELYATVSNGTFVEFDGTDVKVNAPTLDMMHGTVGEDSKFGDEVDWATITTENFTKNTDIKATSSVLVRVNPVNANLGTAKIMFINSKGEAMDDYVEVESVSKYNELITRGSTIETGLWKVNVQLKDGVDMDAFEKAVVTKDESNNDVDVLFAVAVNNTDTTDADRYVASTFDLAMTSTDYAPVNNLGFKVNGTKVADLKNRWTGSDAVDDNNKSFGASVKEYTWATSSKDYPTPATAIDKDKKNVAADANDARNTKALIAVQYGEAITVSLNDTKLYPNNGSIKSYYVVLDKEFALESAPSEWNAWSSYTYEGLNTITDATKDLTLKVNSTSAVADVIGFRLYAVNYDGTLVDPDGKAFYVEVGNQSTTASVNVTVEATGSSSSEIVALPTTFASCANQTSGTFSQADFDKNGEKSLGGATISYQLYKDAEGKQAATDWKDAKYIKVTLSPVGSFLDDATFTVTTKAMTGIQTINVLTINVTKVLPTKPAVDVTFKAGQLKNGVYTCYLDPSTGSWSTASATGVKDLAQAVSGPSGAAIGTNYKWVIASAQYDATKKQNVDLTVANSAATGATAGEYDLAVAVKGTATNNQEFIDNSTEHATTLYYLYEGVSLTKKDGKLKTAAEDHAVEALTCQTVFACALNTSVMTYKWNTYDYKGDDDKTVNEAINYIVYEDTDPANGSKWSTEGTKAWATYLVASNTYDNAKFGGSWTDAWFVSVDKVELISNDTQKADYYDVSWDAANAKFVFTVRSNSTNPVADVPSTLKITVSDTFGHTNVYTTDFTVKRKE